MTGAPRLQINENLTFQSWFWAGQRVTWVLFGVLVVAALLGFTGGGGRFAQGVVADAYFSVTFPAVTRRRAEAEMDIKVTADRGQTLVHFDTAFQQAFDIVSTSPPASEAVATSTGVFYRFDLSGHGPKTIRLVLGTRLAGTIDYTVVVDGRMALLTSLILP